MNDKYKIDHNSYRKNKQLIVFLSIFALLWGIGATLGVWGLLSDFSSGQLFAVFFCSLVCLLTLGILFSGDSDVLISVEGDNIVAYCTALPCAKKSMPIADVQWLILRSDIGPALTILHRNGRDCIPVAPFVGLEGKRKILNDVCQFLRENGAKCEAVDTTKSAK